MDPTRDPHLGLPDDIDEKVHCRRFDAQEPMMFPTYYYFLTFLFHTIDACLINWLNDLVVVAVESVLDLARF